MGTMDSFRLKDKSRLAFQAPPQSSWRCGKVIYQIKYTNSTHAGHVDVDPGRDTFDFASQPGTRWEFQMRTVSVDDTGNRGEGSDWSAPVEHKVPGVPGKFIEYF